MSRVRSVNLSANAFFKDSDDFFQSGKLFISKPITVSSWIDPTHFIMCGKLLVFLTCRKSESWEVGAMLYLEGMRKNGQHFLSRYSFESSDPELDPNELVTHRGEFIFHPFEVGSSSVECRLLLVEIKEQRKKSLLMDSPTKKGKPLEWCELMLNLIGHSMSTLNLKIDGKNCLIL